MAQYQTAHGSYEIPEVRLMTTSVGEIAIRDTDGDGPVAVALHGWGVDSVLNYGRCLSNAREWGRLIAIDLPGHGDSERRIPFRIDTTADAVFEVVEQLGLDPVVAIGYSLGGAVVQSLLEHHGRAVRKTVYVATAARFGDRARWTLPVITSALRAGQFLPHLGIERSGSGYTTRRHLLHLAGSNDSRALAEALESGASHDGAQYERLRSVPAVSIITNRDHVIPSRDQRKLADLAGASCITVDSGHDVCFESGFADLIASAISGS